ncbi:hypothetical protein GC194_08785 [bacterium]|nr:hypothetical protein [bacterium]
MSDLLDDELIEPKEREYQFKTGMAIFWSMPWLLGILFNTLHWPGYSLLIALGAAGIMAYSISGLITFKGKNFTNNVVTAIALVYLFRQLYIIGIVHQHAITNFVLLYLGILVLLLAVIELLKKRYYGIW